MATEKPIVGDKVLYTGEGMTDCEVEVSGVDNCTSDLYVELKLGSGIIRKCIPHESIAETNQPSWRLPTIGYIEWKE